MPRVRWIAVVAAMLVATGCPADSSESPTGTTPPATGQTIWALGDSQAANSNDPARGLPWSLRIGADVGNGGDGMYGAGWTLPGSYTGQTVVQRAAAIGAQSSVTEYVVMAGINDLTGGRSVTQMLAGVTEFADYAAAVGAKVTWVGVVPLPQTATISNREADRRAFNTALAQRYGTRYVDCSPQMSNAAGYLTPGLSLGPLDLHLNNAGEQALADCINAFRH
jgi:lysophospholipase L1-like esterase